EQDRRMKARWPPAPGASDRGPDLPGRELVLAVPVEFALGARAGGGFQDQAVDLLAQPVDRVLSGDDRPAIQVDVLALPLPTGIVGAELERRRRHAAVG